MLLLSYHFTLCKCYNEDKVKDVNNIHLETSSAPTALFSLIFVVLFSSFASFACRELWVTGGLGGYICCVLKII